MYLGATTHILVDLPLPECLRALADMGWDGGELALIHLREIADAPRPEARAEEIGYQGIFNLEIGPLCGRPIDAQLDWARSVYVTARWLLAGGGAT